MESRGDAYHCISMFPRLGLKGTSYRNPFYLKIVWWEKPWSRRCSLNQSIEKCVHIDDRQPRLKWSPGPRRKICHTDIPEFSWYHGLYMFIWRFPEIVVPQIIHLMVFSIINHPFWGTPIYGNPGNLANTVKHWGPAPRGRPFPEGWASHLGTEIVISSHLPKR